MSQIPEVIDLVLTRSFSVLPVNHPERDMFSIQVEFRGNDYYAVKRNSQCLKTDGKTWDYEMSPSNRTDEWLKEHRFTENEARQHARRLCREITVNGHHVSEIDPDERIPDFNGH